uniref:Uncharacterized protein n=1 Tax=Oryza brachyantha TaxID=4533 RepID=J3MSC2_ORYBR
MGKDHSIQEEEPVAPTTIGDNDATLAEQTLTYQREKATWDNSDRVALTIMQHTINPEIRGALPKDRTSAKEFLTNLEEHFKGSSRALASTLMTRMMTTKYDGHGSVREHIMKLIDAANQLRTLECLFLKIIKFTISWLLSLPYLKTSKLITMEVIRSGV